MVQVEGRRRKGAGIKMRRHRPAVLRGGDRGLSSAGVATLHLGWIQPTRHSPPRLPRLLLLGCGQRAFQRTFSSPDGLHPAFPRRRRTFHPRRSPVIMPK